MCTEVGEAGTEFLREREGEEKEDEKEEEREARKADLYITHK